MSWHKTSPTFRHCDNAQVNCDNAQVMKERTKIMTREKLNENTDITIAVNYNGDTDASSESLEAIEKENEEWK